MTLIRRLHPPCACCFSPMLSVRLSVLRVMLCGSSAGLATPAAWQTAGRQLDDVNGRLASIGEGVDMKRDMIKRNQNRTGELLREVRCVLTR